MFHLVIPREKRFSIRQTILPMSRHRFEKQSTREEDEFEKKVLENDLLTLNIGT